MALARDTPVTAKMIATGQLERLEVDDRPAALGEVLQRAHLDHEEEHRRDERGDEELRLAEHRHGSRGGRS